jgi:hypothetical protein
MWAALTGRAKTPDPSAEYSGSDAGSIDVGPKKVLKVSIGAKETGDKVWHAVNDDEHPTLVESEDGVFRVSVRVKDFNVRSHSLLQGRWCLLWRLTLDLYSLETFRLM